MKKNLRPAPGTILLDDKCETDHRREVVDRVVETDDQIVVHTTFTLVLFDEHGEVTNTYRSKRTEKRQKFFAVNGPLQGQRVVEDEAPGYVVFNNSGRSCRTKVQTRRAQKRGEIPLPSVVLVWAETFK